MSNTLNPLDRDDVIVRCKGVDYVGWTQSEVDRSLETLAGTFSIPITFDYSRPAPIVRGDAVQVLFGKTVVVSGWALSAEPFYSKSDVGLRILGRDRAGDLIKSSAMHKGGQWRGVLVDRIVRDLVAPFGMDVVVEDGIDLGKKIDDFKLAHGETVLDALSRVVRLRGLLVTRTALGHVAITKAGTRVFAGAIVGGRQYAQERGGNVIDMSGVGTDENRHSEYIAFGQGHTTAQMDFETARQLKARAVDPEITRYMPLVLNPEGNITKEDLQTLVDHTARVRRGQAWGYRYKVEGWTVGGVPWPTNERVAVWDDIAGIHGEEWLIVSSKQHCDLKDGKVTELVVKPVDAYATAPLKTKQKKGFVASKQNKGAR